MDPTRRLLPRPRTMALTGDRWAPPATVRFAIEAPPVVRARLARRVSEVLLRAGLTVTPANGDPPVLDLALRGPVAAPGSREAQAYQLTVGQSGARITARAEAGLHHGLATLGQWLRPARRERGASAVPGLTVEDRPSLAARGVLLDISRDQVPTLASLRALIDQLADWKVNQLQLYLEHAFAYAGHERVWRGASPLTADQMRGLDATCRERGIELVPNQNSFGHFHRWLVHEPYRRLAECPEGVAHPFSRRVEPFSLCATDPGSLELLAGLYDQLLPCFGSRRFNVGLDETLDLGQCRSRAACAARGRHAVYLDFVRAVRDLAAERGRRIQMWGDIVLERPEHVADLPDDVTVLAWGYEADHPFDEQARRLRASGLPFYLCPGTSSWLSWAGRTGNALANLASAVRAAAGYGAEGVLICDWGDRGHLQPWIASLAGLVAGAAFAWNADDAERPDELPLGDLLDAHAFALPERGLGPLVARLGDAYRRIGTPAINGSPLFHLLASSDDDLEHVRYRGLDEAGLDAAAEAVGEVRSCLGALPAGGDAVARDELAWAADTMTLATALGRARLGAGRAAPLAAVTGPIKRDLARRLAHLIDRRRTLWLRRNRSGGLTHALADLRRTVKMLG